MGNIIEIKNLKKKYDDKFELGEIDITIPKGVIVGLIGENGAGKTTLIRLICGLQNPTSGTYSIYGVKNTSTNVITVRKRIGAIIETPSIYLDMTAEQNLKQQFKIIGLPITDYLYDILELVGLDRTGKKQVKNFSLGMKQRLGIAVALVGHPDFLVLDEPINRT